MHKCKTKHTSINTQQQHLERDGGGRERDRDRQTGRQTDRQADSNRLVPESPETQRTNRDPFHTKNKRKEKTLIPSLCARRSSEVF